MRNFVIAVVFAAGFLFGYAFIPASSPARADIIIVPPPPPPPPADPVVGVVKKKVWIKKVGPYIFIYVIVDTFGGAIYTSRCENREMDQFRLGYNLWYAIQSCQVFAQKFPKKYLANINKPWGPKPFSQWTAKEYQIWFKQAGGG